MEERRMSRAQAQTIADLHAALARSFRAAGRKDQADYHEGVAAIYQRLAQGGAR
jgi:hypothetical protein